MKIDDQVATRLREMFPGFLIDFIRIPQRLVLVLIVGVRGDEGRYMHTEIPYEDAVRMPSAVLGAFIEGLTGMMVKLLSEGASFFEESDDDVLRSLGIEPS